MGNKIGKRNRYKLDNLASYVTEITDNIGADRSLTTALLTELMDYIKNNKRSGEYSNLSLAAAKYVETLQRSNEQLVKVAAIISRKTEDDKNEELSEDDVNKVLSDIPIDPGRE